MVVVVRSKLYGVLFRQCKLDWCEVGTWFTVVRACSAALAIISL